MNLAMEKATVHVETATTLDVLPSAVEEAGYGVQREPVILSISGTTCATRVEKALKKVPGVTDATDNLATEKAKIYYYIFGEQT